MRSGLRPWHRAGTSARPVLLRHLDGRFIDHTECLQHGPPRQAENPPKLTPTITIMAAGRVARSRFGSGMPPASGEVDDASGVRAPFAPGDALVMTLSGLTGRLARLRQARSCAISLDGRTIENLRNRFTH